MIRRVAIWEIIWTGGWPHLSVLPHLPGVPTSMLRGPKRGYFFDRRGQFKQYETCCPLKLYVGRNRSALLSSSLIFMGRPHTGRKLHGFLNQMQNISLRSSGIRRKQNFEFLGLKVTQQSWLLLFTLSPPLYFRFSCLIFLSCWAFGRLHFGGKSLEEKF